MTEKTVGGNNSMESSFKERLTSLKVKVRLFQKDEATGFRDQRTSVSECIGVWQGATNDDVSKFDDALLTRFHLLHFHETNRDFKSIADLLHAHKNLSDAEKRKLNQFITELRVEQYRYYLVEKLIMTNCLPDFDNKNCQLYFKLIWEKLRKAGYNVHNRTIERMMIMTRILSICLGLEYLFNVESGLHREKPFEINMLKDIKPYLYPSAEVMQFVVGLFADQLVNPVENDILDAVRGLHEASASAKRFRMVDDEPGGPATPDQARNQTEASFGRDPNVVGGSSVMPKKKPDYNYVAFSKSVSATADEIHKAMDQNASR